MDNVQSGWVISDITPYNNTFEMERPKAEPVQEAPETPRAEVSTEVPIAHKKEKKRKATKRSKSMFIAAPRRKKKQAKEKEVLTSQEKIMRLVYIGLVSLFLVGLLILGESLVITELNNDVRALQGELTNVTEMNDSKKGQLVSSQDLGAIEATARSYGMAEPGATQYVYETTIQTQSASAKDADNGNWFQSIFK